jgi:hypothetical protein
VVIDIPVIPSRLVVTDGFHITTPLELKPSQIRTYFKIVCAIEDEQLIGGIFIIGFLYLVGTLSENLVIQLMSVVPIFYFLFVYYIKRNKFIQILPA